MRLAASLAFATLALSSFCLPGSGPALSFSTALDWAGPASPCLADGIDSLEVPRRVGVTRARALIFQRGWWIIADHSGSLFGAPGPVACIEGIDTETRWRINSSELGIALRVGEKFPPLLGGPCSSSHPLTLSQTADVIHVGRAHGQTHWHTAVADDPDTLVWQSKKSIRDGFFGVYELDPSAFEGDWGTVTVGLAQEWSFDVEHFEGDCFHGYTVSRMHAFRVLIVIDTE